MARYLVKFTGIVSLIVFAFVVTFAALISQGPRQTEASDFPTLYGEFNSSEVKGVVEVVGFGGPNAKVTARFTKAPDESVLGFCVVVEGRVFGCQSRSSSVSAIDENGCASFAITFSEPVNFTGLLNYEFVSVFDTAEMSSEKPHGPGRLNYCR